MDEYESEDELGDMYCSPRTQKNKKPTSSASKSQPKPQSMPSKPQSSKPPVAGKPAMSASKKSSTSPGTTASAKPVDTAKPDDAVGSFLGMKEYMDAMDRELAKTTVGKSFVREGDKVCVCLLGLEFHCLALPDLSLYHFCHLSDIY